jgi:RimJ/RimL family protein N-acetyltransferase
MQSSLEHGLLEFRPLRESDLPLLAQWRARAHVAEWFGPPDSIDDLRREFFSDAGAPQVQGFLALLDGQPVGFIQAYVAFNAGGGWWPDERDPGARGIDQFLAEEYLLGRGLGTCMVRAFVARLFGDPTVTRVQTDPAPENTRAIRSYEKAGFARVGVVDTPDGPALLMVCTRDRFEAR